MRATLCEMSGSVRNLLQDLLALPEGKRLELASETIASVDGPSDADWESAWLGELDRRAHAPELEAGRRRSGSRALSPSPFGRESNTKPGVRGDWGVRRNRGFSRAWREQR